MVCFPLFPSKKHIKDSPFVQNAKITNPFDETFYRWTILNKQWNRIKKTKRKSSIGCTKTLGARINDRYERFSKEDVKQPIPSSIFYICSEPISFFYIKI